MADRNNTVNHITGELAQQLAQRQREQLIARKKELRAMGANSVEGITVVNGKVRQLVDE